MDSSMSMNTGEKVEKGSGQNSFVPGRQVQIMAEPAHIGPPHHTLTGPKITLIKDGETVKTIEITCTCGERIRLQCVY
jgi:hypothetical protein